MAPGDAGVKLRRRERSAFVKLHPPLLEEPSKDTGRERGEEKGFEAVGSHRDAKGHRVRNGGLGGIGMYRITEPQNDGAT